MAGAVAWAVTAVAVGGFGVSRDVATMLLWALDRVDRAFNPQTKERIRRQNRIRAEYIRTTAAKNKEA